MRPTKRYMSSRQVQKLSSPEPRRSVRPASPNWNAWLCTFGSPGRPIAWRSSPGCAPAPSSIRPMRPAAHSSRTAPAHPCGSSADSNHTPAMAYIIDDCPVGRSNAKGAGVSAQQEHAWLSVRRGAAPLLLCMPHTGTQLPDGIEARLRSGWLARKDTDWWIDRLYEFAPRLGASVIRTAISRTVIDPN